MRNFHRFVSAFNRKEIQEEKCAVIAHLHASHAKKESPEGHAAPQAHKKSSTSILILPRNESHPHSSSLNTLIFTSCAIVRFLNPRAFIRSTNGASILNTLIWINSCCVG